MASKSNKGLSSQLQALNSTFYDISTKTEQSALFKLCDYGDNIGHLLHIYSAPNGTYSTCRYIRVILSDRYIFANYLLTAGTNNIRLFKDNQSFYAYIYGGIWTRSFVEVFSSEAGRFQFENVTNEISISDLTEIPIS